VTRLYPLEGSNSPTLVVETNSGEQETLLEGKTNSGMGSGINSGKQKPHRRMRETARKTNKKN